MLDEETDGGCFCDVPRAKADAGNVLTRGRVRFYAAVGLVSSRFRYCDKDRCLVESLEEPGNKN